MMDPGAPLGASAFQASGWRVLKDGLDHVLTTPQLLALLWLAFLVNLTAYPVTTGLLPYAARRVYMTDATGLGWLAASFAFGALLGSIVMVVTGGPRRSERAVLAHTVIWYALLLAFAHLPTLGPGLFALLLAGFVQSVAMISMTACLLTAAGDRFRSRVMGTRMLAVYGMPMGLMGLGVLIERVGYSPTVSGHCAVGLLGTLLIGVGGLRET